MHQCTEKGITTLSEENLIDAKFLYKIFKFKNDTSQNRIAKKSYSRDSPVYFTVSTRIARILPTKWENWRLFASRERGESRDFSACQNAQIEANASNLQPN